MYEVAIQILTDCAFMKDHYVQMTKLEKDDAFAERIRQMVLAKNWQSLTRIELGKKLGVTGPCVQFYLTGERLPGMAQARAIASIFGVCVEWLLTGKGPMRPNNDIDYISIGHLDFHQKQLLSMFMDTLKAQPAQPAQPLHNDEISQGYVDQKSH